jgi:hypothetical protein
MNKRIRELAEQAGATTFGGKQCIFGDEDMEKFAELIVKECANVELYWLGEQDCKAIAEKIKKHFGVK